MGQSQGRWEEMSPQYRNYWQQQYGNQGGKWEDYEPVYQYGWQMRSNPQYQNRSWNEVEPQLRKDWETRYPNKPWDKNANMLRDMWTSDFGGTMGSEQSRSVPIREEQLTATKQPVQAGEVRVGKNVVTEEKNVSVPVKREQVYVEQRDVSARPSDRPIGEGETISVPVVEEQVNVEKKPVVTGEVRIGKQQVQENQQYSDTIKREEPTFEQEGDVDIQGSGAQQFDSNQPENRP